ERAQVVKDLLVKKYGISADRLKVAAGGSVDKFGQPILNRVALVESAQ
ncbi:OmpA family protein, partial [Bacteroides ovatus]